MNLKFSALFFLLLSAAVFSQTYEYSSSLGSFRNASSFHINSAGFIYVADRGNNEIYKLDTLGNLLKDNGGFGWDDAAFDDPSGIFASTLNVYVSDRNNHRIQYFDKDLNYISALKTRDSENQEIQFGYPAGVSVNRQGDLFILDFENKRVIKFDLFGNFILNFGGYNYGRYSLTDPVKISAGPNNNIFVAEKERIVIFDQYGNGAGDFLTGRQISDLNIVFNDLTIISGGTVLSAQLNSPELIIKEVTLNDYSPSYDPVSSFIFNKKLYILTPKKIDVFRKISD
jgi:hypothetical protein